MKRFLAPGLGRRVGVVIGVVAIVTQLSVLSFVAWGAGNVSTVRDWLVVGKVAGSTQLTDYVTQAGLSASGRFYLFAANPTLHTPDTFDEACPHREAGIAALGCYSAIDDTIHLLDITDDSLTILEPVVAAHVALHAVWSRFDATERSAISAEVEKSFSRVSSPALLGRLAVYESMTPAERIPELFAVLGTESALVTPELEAVYARYFIDRRACVELAASSANVIAEISNSIESVGSQILAAEQSVAKKMKSYKRERRALIDDIQAFNTAANSPGQFASSSTFTTQRKALATRKTRLERSRIALNELIDNYNSLVTRMTELNTKASSLNAALGIDASAMLTVPAEP